MSSVTKKPVKKSSLLCPDGICAVDLKTHVFVGGTSLNWSLFYARLKAALNAKQAGEFINLSGAVAADGTVSELSFGLERPCAVGQEDAYVQDLINQQIETINAALLSNITMYDGLQMNAGAKAVKIVELRAKANNDNAKIQNDRRVIRHDLGTSIARFEEQEKEFLQRRADCVKIFYQMLGAGPLSIAEPFLSVGRPRAAFAALNSHYSAGVGGQQAASAIMKQMQNFPIDLSMATLSEHMALMERLNAEFEGGGINRSLPPAFIMHNFLEALSRATDLFNDEILFITQNNTTWEAAKLKLKERESHLLAKGIDLTEPPGTADQFDGDGLPRHLYDLVSDEVRSTLKRRGESSGNRKKKLLPTCAECGKRGHDTEHCWSQVTCPVCGDIGHITKYCPLVKGKPFGQVVYEEESD